MHSNKKYGYVITLVHKYSDIFIDDKYSDIFIDDKYSDIFIIVIFL